MPFVETRFISPTTLTTSAVSLYTVPTGYSAIIKQFVVTNISASAATFTFYVGTASASNALFSNTSVAANDTVIINLSQVLTTGETLRALASAGSALNLTVSGVLNDGPLASTATYIPDGAITSAKIAPGPTISLPSIDNFRLGFTSTVTSAGTTTLTNASNNQQVFTGTATQAIVMPVASTMTVGTRYVIENNSNKVLGVYTSDGSTLISTIIPGTSIKATSILASGTTAASWDVEYVGFNAITGTGSVVMSDSPAFTGTPTAPTASSVTNNTQLATTAYVTTADNLKANIASPTFTGTVTLPTSVSVGDASLLSANTSSQLHVRKDTAGGKGGEISIVNYASNTNGNSAALNFGVDTSSYGSDSGNAQIRATLMNSGNGSTELGFLTWNGGGWDRRMYIDSAGVPRYSAKSNVYGWHVAGEQIGTALTVGAYGRNATSFASGANSWLTIGAVGVTIPANTNVIVCNYNFSCYFGAVGRFFVRVYYDTDGATGTTTFYTNESYTHKVFGGVIGVGVAGGNSGTFYLQVYGEAITIISDANDSAYFTVTTP